jgi:hypothetical protein
VHSYFFNQPEKTPEAWAGKMANLEASLRRFNSNKEVPIYVTEMGWSTYSGPNGVSDEVATDYLAQVYLLAQTMPFIKGIWWYDLIDDGWNTNNFQDNFGLLLPDLTPKPVFYALRDLQAALAGSHFVKRLQVADGTVYALEFERPDGRRCLAIWTYNGKAAQLVLRGTPGDAPIQLTRVGHGSLERRWAARRWPPSDPAPLAVTTEFDVVLSGRPILLEGIPQDVSVRGVEWREPQ